MNARAAWVLKIDAIGLLGSVGSFRGLVGQGGAGLSGSAAVPRLMGSSLMPLRRSARHHLDDLGAQTLGPRIQGFSPNPATEGTACLLQRHQARSPRRRGTAAEAGTPAPPTPTPTP